MVATACSSSDNSPTSSTASSTMSDENSEDIVEDSFWGGLARRAKTVLEDPPSEIKRKDSKVGQRIPVSDGLALQKNGGRQLTESKWKRQESIVLNRGLEAIASSLSLLSDTLGNALEEGLNIVETKATNFIYTDPRSSPLKKNLDTTVSEKRITDVPKHHTNSEEKLSRSQVKSEEKALRSQVKSEEKVLISQIKAEEKQGVTKDTQLKASRDVSMAMATKAKLLLRELKGVKTDLAFTKARCTQLEEENKRLRENIDKGEKHEEDDLVRLQLEALLAEKARLVQENAAYARENQFLHEVVQYHQLRLRSIGFPDESLMLDDEGPLDASAVDMDFLPLYPEEKDIIALEESVKIATTQHPV
ncbi:hypothetical protein GOP47_0021867 [Adiantum capillus-veneris]|uniref:Uncharacterized protein n=1 Tax=Adiantum capillus-veneris TaxID=13818 RepID=A0A9D4U8I9_ADICA|nr:hypothetical protein GOP47_0021867 [Adiantum capillus-veneris]